MERPSRHTADSEADGDRRWGLVKQTFECRECIPLDDPHSALCGAGAGAKPAAVARLYALNDIILCNNKEY